MKVLIVSPDSSLAGAPVVAVLSPVASDHLVPEIKI